MKSEYDFVVVGAGVMGMSTALYLTLKYPQAKCAIIEQFTLKHEEGSSHSQIRIIRSAYKHPFYRDLTLLAIEKNWAQVEKLFGQKFIVDNPFLAFVENQDLFQDYLEVANTSTNIRKLTTEQLKGIFPQPPHIIMNRPVFMDTKAGIIMAKKYINRLTNYLLQVKNLDIFEETEVNSIKNDSKGVTLGLISKGNKREIRAGKVTLSCGRWMSKLVPSVAKILIPVRQTISFWKMKNRKNFQIGAHPSWCHFNGKLCIYNLPDVENDGIKFGVHSNDSQLQKKFATQQQFIKFKLQQVKGLLNTYFKGQCEELLKFEKCYYTNTKSEDFLIDWTDEFQNVLMVSPCSGHGFKFSPILGQIVSQLLQNNKSIQLFQQYRYLTRLFYHEGVNLE